MSIINVVLSKLTVVDGEVRWISPRKPRRDGSMYAGSINNRNGNILIEVGGKNILSSRAAYIIHYGREPNGRVVFLDGNKRNHAKKNISDTSSSDFTKDKDEALRLFEYRDGKIFWKETHSAMSRASVGDEAGYTDNNGYRRVKIAGKRYKTANIVWLMHYGEWPSMLDHINHNRLDDRIENLREVTNSENSRNRSLNSKNKSGATGVYMDKGRWVAKINDVNGNRVVIGRFSEKKDAIKARKEAEKKYHYHSNHGK